MSNQNELSRRDLIAKTAVAGAAMAVPSFVFAGSQAQIKVGLIGCGGRGTGAAQDNIEADSSTVLWAMGDVFPDRLNGSRDGLKKLGDRYKVTDDRAFSGWDAYKKVIESGVDVVILTTPPAFRPMHLKAAIAAGKHVFMEKPVATDAPGIRSVMESSDIAASKKLSIVAGTQ